MSPGSSAGCRRSRRASELPGVKDVRVLGAIGVVQLDHPIDGEAATRAVVDQGVWLRPFRDLVYTMPPYVTDDEDIARIARRRSRERRPDEARRDRDRHRGRQDDRLRRPCSRPGRAPT